MAALAGDGGRFGGKFSGSFGGIFSGSLGGRFIGRFDGRISGRFGGRRIDLEADLAGMMGVVRCHQRGQENYIMTAMPSAGPSNMLPRCVSHLIIWRRSHIIKDVSPTHFSSTKTCNIPEQLRM